MIAFMLSYSTKRSAIICFFNEIVGGGVMYLVYGSSSSSYMDCMVFFGDECCISRQSGVRLTPCACICASVVGLVIFGNAFCGSPTFRMSTRRVTRLTLCISYRVSIYFPVVLLRGVPVVVGGGFYLIMRTMACQ